MERNLRNRTLALAAVFQSLALVKAVAWTGRCDDDAFQSSVGSLFHFDAPDIDTIYGGIAHLRTGLKTLGSMFGIENSPPDRELAEYAIRLMFLERRLDREPEVKKRLHEGLMAAERQYRHFGDIGHASVIARIAETYQETISPLGPRVMVSGEPVHLNNPEIAARIRALLLAGIRAAVLWRQAGGNRWRLLFQRQAMLTTCNDLLTASI